MNCQEVRDLLSSYFDGELVTDAHDRVAKHLESCTACTEEIAGFGEISTMAENLAHPAPQPEIWRRIEDLLDTESKVVTAKSVAVPGRILPRLAAIAALLLVTVSLGVFAQRLWFENGHAELTVDFSQYLEALESNPDDAHLVLHNKYAGIPLELDRATSELGYRPTVAAGLPDGYSMQNAYVLDMPCCKCVQCVCQTSDGRTLVIFEHDEVQPMWFGDRPSINTVCGGQPCSITQLNGHIAASLKIGKRHLTVLGAQDTEEVTRIVEHLTRT